MVKLIVAMDQKGAIAYKNRLPWKNESELVHFYETISGKNVKVLMGRKTFESLPKKDFWKEKVIVVTRSKIDGIECIHRDSIIPLFKKYEKTIIRDLFICGGKQLYEEYYQYADELIISEIEGVFEADTFVNFDLTGFALLEKKRMPGYIIKIYKRTFKI